MIKDHIVFMAKIKEDDAEDIEDNVHTFVGANTLPDRVAEQLPDGTIIAGEVLSKNVLNKIAGFINDESNFGGKIGSYRTVSLFHNRVHESNPGLEEAGFVKPNARVNPMKDHPGNFQLEVDVETNKMYTPPENYKDYTPDKINYKIDKDALGLSIEYNNEEHQEKIVDVGNEKYRFVMDTDDFRGFGFARPNLIGNPGAVRIKEITDKIKNISKMGDKMTEEEIKALQAKLKESEDEKKKLEEELKKKKLEEELKKKKDKKKEDDKGEDSEKVKELEAKLKEVSGQISGFKLAQDETAIKFKESMELALANLAIAQPAANAPVEKKSKFKEVEAALEKKDWVGFQSAAAEKVKEQIEMLKTNLKKGIDLEDHQTLKVKCQGRDFVVEATAKTKDTIDSNDMAESTYNQTNAMFADRYVAGITETFLKDESLISAMIKEQHIGGNDKYQWRIWTEFDTFTGDNTLAVDPNVTAVNRTQRDFEKMETRIVEYRDGVEVTDFTQFHSAAAIGDLMAIELNRAAEAVSNSMDADLFKGKTDSTAAWLGFVGLLGVADSGTYTAMYGKTRTAANRLLDATLTNTYDSTAEAITIPIVREGYEKVLGQGSKLSEIAIVAHPIQVRKLFDSQDSALSGTANTLTSIRHQAVSMGAAPEFGFKRDIIPHIDGIPIIRDYYCTDASGTGDTIAVVDMGPNGYVLVTSKPLGARGLAKVGTSEAAYVNFWGAAVYKRPRNVWLHDDLTAT